MGNHFNNKAVAVKTIGEQWRLKSMSMEDSAGKRHPMKCLTAGTGKT